MIDGNRNTHVLHASNEGVRPSGSLPLLLGIIALIGIPGALAYGLTTSNEMQVAAGVVALLALIAVFARPYIGLILFVVLLYVRPEETFPALAGMRLTFGVALLTLIATWFQLSVNRERIVRTPVNGLIVGFGIVAVVSGMSVGREMDALAEVGKLVVLVLLILNLVRSRDRYQSIVNALLGCTLYLALYSVYLYLQGHAFVQDGELLRAQATGIFNDPNDLAATIVAGLALALTRVTLTKGWSRASYIAICVIMLGATLLTNSRGGMISLFVVVIGSYLTFSRQRKRAIVMAALTALVLFALAPGRMKNFDSEETSASSRFYFWENGVSMVLNQPLTGIGFRRFPELNGGYTAHNSFVLCFGELGLPGYFCWMGVLYFCYRRRVKPEQASEVDSTDDRELLGARLALTGYLAAAFFISRTYVAVPYLLMSLPLAKQISISAAPELFRMNAGESVKTFAKIGAICVGSIAIISLIANVMM